MTDARGAAGDGQPAGTVAGWVRVVVVVAVALVALWFCFRTMVLSLYAREYPLIGEAMSPPSAVSQAIIALNRASARAGVADPLARSLLESALRRSPMLSEPFVVAGLDASARNDFGRARRLFQEAERRDPRAIIPRYWLFDDYLRGGDYAQGIAEATPLMRVQPASEPAAVAVLTALIEVPAARPALLAALRSRPSWRATFFRQAADSPRLREPAAALLRELGTGGTVSSGRDQRSVVAAMVDAGQYDRAYALWRESLAPNQRPAAPGLFHGGFSGDLATPPFGWRLSDGNGSVGVVGAPDARSGSGLAIRSDGSRARTVAEQLVLAAPGALRLTFATRALGRDPGSAGLKVQLRCAVNGKPLASETVGSFGDRLEPHSVAADLPAKCKAVVVRVSVAPGIEAGRLDVLLTDMTLSGG